MLHELEWQTRKERIDRKLAAINPPWVIVPFNSGLDTSSLNRRQRVNGLCVLLRRQAPGDR